MALPGSAGWFYADRDCEELDKDYRDFSWFLWIMSTVVGSVMFVFAKIYGLRPDGANKKYIKIN